MRGFVMEKNFECHSSTNDLLSQSYCNGIQKIAGTEDAITSDFQISGEILDKRKNAWNNLFEKYSTMVSEVEFNIHTLQPEEPMDLPEVSEQRLPMRKPISMVQYWVDTGNLLHMNCTNNLVHSDSGSSIIEEDDCEPDQNNDSQSLATNLSMEKNSNIAETSGNKNLKIVTSSNSSIDTAAYILANNNITKKAETIAIVEGSKVDTATHSPVKMNNSITNKAETIAIIESSKVDTKTQSPVKLTPHILEMSKTTSRISLARKNNHEKFKLANFLRNKSCTEKITENIKTAKFNKMCENKVNSKSKPDQSHMCSKFFSDSDESISNIQNSTIQNDRNENNQNNNNVSKFLKRKKLYNRSDSPAEFTPVSEDNLSLHTSKVILRRCLPLRRSEHPALETPKTSSRYLTRNRQTKFKRKIIRHQSLSSISTSDEKSENHELLDSNQNNVNSRPLHNFPIPNTKESLDQTGSKENCNTDLMLSKKHSDEDIHMKESDVQNSINRTSSLSSSSELLKNKLKTCKIVIQKLPYKYYSSKPSKNITKKKNLIDSEQSKRIEQVNKNYISNMDPISNAKDLSENACGVRANDVKIFNNTKTFRDIFGSREKEIKSSYTKRSNYSSSHNFSTETTSGKRSEMIRNDSLYKEKSKYVIVDSSSDESDLILTSTKNKTMSKPRKSKKLSGKNFSYDECSNITNKESNQSSSHKQETIKHKVGNKCNADDNVQCLGMKENSFSRDSRREIPSRDYKNNKNKIKSRADTSSAEKGISSPIKEKNTSDSKWDCQVFVNRIEETNNKVDVNKKLSELAITYGKTKVSGKMRNERELHASDKSFGSDNSGDVDSLSNSESNKKKTGKLPAPFSAENSRNIQSNTSPAKQSQRRDKSPATQDSTKLKTATKKRKSLEIDLSSDEECIIPLKKKE